jgi:hypothetical protein
MHAREPFALYGNSAQFGTIGADTTRVRLVVRVLLLAGTLAVASIALAPFAGHGQELATGAAAAGSVSGAAGTASGIFAFLSSDDDGQPLRFNPCAPVRYTINPDGAPDGALADVHEAFRRAGAETGITFDYVGPTTEAHERIGGAGRLSYQPNRYGDAWAPVLVSFATEDDEPVLDGNVLGYGGATSYWTSSSDPAYVTGEIVLDRDLALVRPGFGPGMTRGNLVEHELGHVIGLDHVADRSELMYASISGQSPDGYGPGDRVGLSKLGASAGCLDTARP